MWREVLAAVVLLAPWASPAASPEVDGWWTRTLLDADRDRIDDALEAQLVGTAPVPVIVAYAAMPTAAERAALEARGALVTTAPLHFPLLVVKARAADVPRLLDAPGVVFLEADDTLRPLLKESGPLVGAPQAWQRYKMTGKDVVVAVLDEGAFEQHPDLEPKLVGHYDANSAGAPVPGGPVDPMAPAGEEGHGTHVAGIVVSGGRESEGVYKGIAPDAKFVNVKVFSGPNQTTSELVLRGLDWTLDNAERLHIRVASLSLGGRASDGTDALSRSVDVAVDKGMIVIAAVGNAGPDVGTVTSPGAAEKAITVGAVDKQKRVAPFSSRGPTPDGRLKPEIVAPGVNIVSTVPPVSTGAFNHFLQGGRSAYYGPLSGTSMATPHVAGAVALMLEADPSLSPFRVRQILLVTAQDVGKPGIDNETGYGFLNAVAAVQVTLDPALLSNPQFRSRLDTIPEPSPESVLDRLAFEISAFSRALPSATLGLGALVVLVALVSVGARLRR